MGKNYDLLLENFMILIDKDVRDLYKQMNTRKKLRCYDEDGDLLNRHRAYMKMKKCIANKLKGCNPKKPMRVVLHLHIKGLYPLIRQPNRVNR